MQSFRLVAVSMLLAIGTLTACSDSTGPTGHAWDGDCDLTSTSPNATTLLVSGTCQFAGMGKTTVVNTHTLNFATSTFTSVGTFTTTNGDKFQTTNTGTAVSTATGVTVSGTETASGGTGQFAKATGSATFTGTVTFTGATTAVGKYTYKGSVNY